MRAAQAEAEGRALIELAKGILVERLGCGPAQAARQLAELTDQAGTTQLEFAVEVINQAARDRMSEVTHAFLAATRAAGEAEGDQAAVRLRAAESGALAADDTQAVAESLLEQALRPLGAVAVAIWAAGADGSLTLAGSAGFSPRRRRAGTTCRRTWRQSRGAVWPSARGCGSSRCRSGGCPAWAGTTTPTAAGRPCPRAPAVGCTACWRSSGGAAAPAAAADRAAGGGAGGAVRAHPGDLRGAQRPHPAGAGAAGRRRADGPGRRVVRPGPGARAAPGRVGEPARLPHPARQQPLPGPGGPAARHGQRGPAAGGIPDGRRAERAVPADRAGLRHG